MPFFSLKEFQPKRRFRFLVSFSNLLGIKYLVKSVNKPSYTMAHKEHNVLNHVFKFPGVIKWNDVKVTFIDAIEPDTGSKFMNVLRNSGYVFPSANPGSLTTGITKAGSVTSLGQVIIQQLDGGSMAISADPGDLAGAQGDTRIAEEWILKNAFIKGVQFGEGLDYSSEEIVEVSLDLVYDYATINEITAKGSVLKLE